jgi:hypothetical protein
MSGRGTGSNKRQYDTDGLVMAYYASRPHLEIDSIFAKDSDEIRNQSNLELELSSLRNDNPEQNCIRRDLYLKLSEEAKNVIRIILASPSEMMETMGLKRKDHSYDPLKIWKFLRKRCGLKIVPARKVLRELKTYATALQDF